MYSFSDLSIPICTVSSLDQASAVKGKCGSGRCRGARTAPIPMTAAPRLRRRTIAQARQGAKTTCRLQPPPAGQCGKLVLIWPWSQNCTQIEPFPVPSTPFNVPLSSRSLYMSNNVPIVQKSEVQSQLEFRFSPADTYCLPGLKCQVLQQCQCGLPNLIRLPAWHEASARHRIALMHFRSIGNNSSHFGRSISPPPFPFPALSITSRSSNMSLPTVWDSASRIWLVVLRLHCRR